MNKIIIVLAIFFCTVNIQAQRSFAIFDNCDNVNGWKSGGTISDYQTSLNTNPGDQRAGGTSCIEVKGDTTEQKFYKLFDTPVDLTDGGKIDVNNAVFSFWFYISDISVLTGRGQIEICSGGGPDNEEWSWYFNNNPGDVKAGWNKYEFDLSSRLSYGGGANMTALNFFRLYFFTKPSESTKTETEIRAVVYRLDDIRITNKSLVNVANYSVSKDVQGVKISWNAINSSSQWAFEIEHSTDGTSFTPLVTIPEESGLPKYYEHIDKREGLIGNNYYRLRYVTDTESVALGTEYVMLSLDPKAVVGKVFAGYQGWFGAPGDGFGNWRHWFGDSPNPHGVTFEVYPDISEYDESALVKATQLAAFGDGREAKLFSTLGPNVIDRHMKWMQEYEIDGAALQRFMSQTPAANRRTVDSVAVRLAKAAEKYNRLFYIMWDMSTTDESRLQSDWEHLVNDLKITQYSSYAHQDGKPVVCIWGFGFDHRGNNTAAAVRMINWLKNDKGCYVIGGIPLNWRTATTANFTFSDFEEVYKAFDMISPWATGSLRMNSLGGHLNRLKDDLTYCQANGLAYQPVAFPGFAWSQWKESNAQMTNNLVNDFPRLAGDFAWEQLKTIRSVGTPNLYLAMFDEYDEGTAWMKNATDWSQIPSNQYFLTASADGYWLSSDYQLRVAREMSRVMKGETLVETLAIPHSEGPVYYRNSFEMMESSLPKPNGPAFKADPCFNPDKSVQISNSGISTGADVTHEKNTQAKSGSYLAKINGTVVNQNSSNHYRKFGEAKIKVTSGMTLSFWKYAVNDRGRYTSMSLQFSDGTLLHNETITDKAGIEVNPRNPRGEVGAWTKHEIVIGQGTLIGKTITGLIIGYQRNESSSGTGNFEAYFDDILIAAGDYTIPNSLPLSTQGKSGVNIYPTLVNDGRITFDTTQTEDSEPLALSILNLQGTIVYKGTILPETVKTLSVNLPKGIYVVLLNGNKTNVKSKLIIE